MRGRSLASVLSGSSNHTYGEEELIGGEMIDGKWMRRGDYKAVLVSKAWGPGKWKLYNVTNDPGETRDLSTEQPEVVKKLVAAWERYAKDVGVVSPE